MKNTFKMITYKLGDRIPNFSILEKWFECHEQGEYEINVTKINELPRTVDNENDGRVADENGRLED